MRNTSSREERERPRGTPWSCDSGTMKLFQIFLRTLLFVLAVLLGAFLTVLFSESPEWIFTRLGVSETEGSTKRYEALKFLGIGMGGVLVGLQALMSYKRAKAMEDTAKAQARATEHQATANQNTEQGQRQERLKNAIEHLGHESDSVRLGGAYELFHLAEDTAELRRTVLDILCVHIRRTTGEGEYREKYKMTPSEEIQSLLTLLFVQEHNAFKDARADLRGSWLNGAILDRAHLEKTNLMGIYLRQASLHKACLGGAWLGGANLQEAMLARAHMQGAVLITAHLERAVLEAASMQGVILLGANLQDANLRAARLQGAVFDNTRLQSANLSGAQLQGISRRDGHEFSIEFAETIRGCVGKVSDLSGIVVEGEASLKDVVMNGGAVFGAYTDEEAEQWIAEYRVAVSDAPKAGSS